MTIPKRRPRTSRKQRPLAGVTLNTNTTRMSVGKSSLEEQFVLEEHYEHGRRYANETYFYPNDDVEETRLNIIHQMFLLILMGELTITRVGQNVERILDVGSGPGDWAIAMAEKYPDAEVVATDVSTYRPTNLPQNVVFQIDDACREWTFTEPFNIIHMRDLHGAFQNWEFVFAEARKHLKPDGKLEIANAGPFKLTVNYEKSYVSLFHGLFRQAMAKSGFAWAPGTRRGELEAVGLKIVKSLTMEVPLGLWSEDPKKKSLGKMALVAALESVEACSLRLFTQYLEWNVDEVKSLCEKVKSELQDRNNRPALMVEFVVARRMPDMPEY